jgi:hypothetical protein
LRCLFSFVTWSVLWSVAPQRPRPHHNDNDALILSTRIRAGKPGRAFYAKQLTDSILIRAGERLYACEFRLFAL